ncbi:hypothetical protein DFJ73DRAFT_878786 [Zopfochytrium polystomum]|nr:hypothetical protein DFJ73DRAFT_878786 [Zopfochytrium polystomum]
MTMMVLSFSVATAAAPAAGSSSSPSTGSSMIVFAAAAATAFAAYLSAVRLLRFRHVNSQAARYAGVLPADLTLRQAREIYLATLRHEFPFMTMLASQLGLFRTYGLPKISALLVATQQLCDPAYYFKRYADTELATLEWVLQPDDSLRANAAIARVNWLHEHYKKHIDRDSMVFTLTVFVVEPARYIAEYEWRPRTDLENEAAARVWHQVGLKMGIADPPRTFAEFVKANEEIEARLMRFHTSNKTVADASFDLFLAKVPAPLRPVVKPALVAAIDPKLAAAVGATYPAPWLVTAVRAALRARGLFVRHCMLPRFQPFEFVKYDDAATGGRAFRTDKTVATYVRPTTWNRWGPEGWLAWAVGAPVPGDKGTFAEGCNVETLGPERFKEAGREDVRQRVDELMQGKFRQNVWVD